MQRILFAAAVCLSAVPAGAAETQPVREGRLAGWYTDFEAARDQARRRHRPLLVVFA